MKEINLLLVDDDDLVRSTLAKVLEMNGFAVTVASSVTEALKLITSNPYDVLLSDLHMPGAGDGLTVVSAMRHSNPRAVTFLLSAHPAMGAATDAIVLQADQILVKPMDPTMLVAALRQGLVAAMKPTRYIETVAAILERSIQPTIERWFLLVQKDEKLMTIDLSREARTGHLPKVLMDLVIRLRTFQPLGSKGLSSSAAREHGRSRREQGYLASMLVEESRILQVSIFDTLQRNLATIDFSVLMIQVMTIADEVDSQLAQAMESYNMESIPAA